MRTIFLLLSLTYKSEKKRNYENETFKSMGIRYKQITADCCKHKYKKTDPSNKNMHNKS